MDIAQLFNCSMVELQERRKKGEFSYTELMRASLALLKQWEGDVHAFITVTKEQAIMQAQHADKVFVKDGVTHPLLGIPFTVKDTFCTQGIQTTAGSNILKDYIPPYTATAVQRVLDAGAVLLGKTNCDSFGHGSSTENSDFGSTRNPWRGKSEKFQYVPGGSSGGSAASLACGIGWFSIGEDTGGSIRQPAAFCGICGLKPTYGRVSRYGSIAYASSLDTVGPMARSASDLRTVFDTIVGPDENDATSAKLPKKEEREIKTFGVPKEFFQDLPFEQSEVIERAIGIFKKIGMVVKEVTLPSTKYAISTYYLLATAETSSNLARFDNIRYGNDRSRFSHETKRRIMLGTHVLQAGYYEQYYALAQKVRTKIIQEYNEVFLA